MAKATASTSPADKPGEGQGGGIDAGTTAGEAGAPGAGDGASGGIDAATTGGEAGAPGAGDGASGGIDVGTALAAAFMLRPILVRSVAAKGRWRIGRHFTQEPILLDAAELDDDQKARLAGDPELIIQAVD
jgi:hypothetical protein